MGSVLCCLENEEPSDSCPLLRARTAAGGRTAVGALVARSCRRRPGLQPPGVVADRGPPPGSPVVSRCRLTRPRDRAIVLAKASVNGQVDQAGLGSMDERGDTAGRRTS